MQAEADQQIRELKHDITHLHENVSILSLTCNDMNQSDTHMHTRLKHHCTAHEAHL